MKFTKVLGIAAGIAAISQLAACTSDNEPSFNNQNPQSNSLLVSAPKIKAWSGSEDLLGGNGGKKIVAHDETPAEVTDAEVAAAKAYFNAKDNWAPANGGTDLEISDLASWTSYYVQEVASGNRLPNDVALFIGTNDDEIKNIAVWNIDADEVLKILNTDDYLINEAKVEVDPDAPTLVTNHAIKDFSFETDGYTFGGVEKKDIRSSGHKGQYENSPNYKIAALDGQDDTVYVALYGYTDSNNGFWNRIIKISKADVADGEDPEEGDVDVVVSDKILHNNEVEVNLSINDTHQTYNVEDLTSKLSIHVRDAKDVKVRIPVPVEILVPVDDLDIVIARPDLLEYGKEHHASFEINGHVVEVFVDFTEATDCAGNGYGYYIEVTTKGINKDVIKYCMERYADGINFEIYNYYQWNVTDEEGKTIHVAPTAEQIQDLRENWLSKSTVEFGYDNGTWNAYTNVSDYPYYYINAFHGDSDCSVKVISNQSYAFENWYEGDHLNGSGNNVIYVREDIWGTDRQDDAHTPGAE